MSYRLRHGLYWRGTRPGWPEIKRWAVGAAAGSALLIVLGIVSDLEAATDRALMAEKAADIYSAKASVLHDCESGKATWYYYQDGRAFQCPKQL